MAGVFSIIAPVRLGDQWMRRLAVASALGYLGVLVLGWFLNAGAGFDGVLRPQPHEIESAFVVLEVEPGSPADAAGIKPGDRVQSVDGNPLVMDIHQAYHNRRVGAPASLTIGADQPRVVSFNLESRLASPAIVLGMAVASAMGIAIVAVGAVVAFVRPAATAARLLLGFALALAISTTEDVWHWTQRTAAAAVVLDSLEVTALLVGAVALVHLFLTFPAPSHLYARVRRALPTMYAVAVVPLVLSRVIQGSDVGPILGTVLLACLLPGALIALELSYRRPATPLARAQLGWIRWGLGVGVLATVLHRLATLLVPEAVPAVMGTIVAGAWLIFPVSLAMAILRYRLFEVERVVRASIIWGLLAAVLLASYLLLVVVVGRLAASLVGPSIGSEADPTVSVVAVLVVAAMFHPVRVRLLGIVGQHVYRHRLARERVLDQATAHLSEPHTPADTARFLCQQVPRSLGLAGGWLAVPPDQARLFELDPRVLMPNVSLASPALVDSLESVHGPVLLARPEDLDAYQNVPALSAESPGAPPWYLAGGRIIVPLRAGNHSLLALWVLGAPTLGDLLEREDVAALDRLAALAAIQVERERGALGGFLVNPSDDDLLTEREHEVLRLLARGYSNRQIADELIIGVRTAETHVQRILRKLELDNRAQAIVWAREHPAQTTPPSPTAT